MVAFGRIESIDPRDTAYPLRAITQRSRRTKRQWRLDKRGRVDQLQTPRCVGYSFRQYLNCGPKYNLHKGPSADEIYAVAQLNDEWPGTAYDGSSVRAGAIALVQAGKVTEYRWANGITDVADYLLNHGPIVFGTNWLTGMMEPNLAGIVHAQGGVEGGHAYLVDGVNLKTHYYTIDNTWGTDWGLGGRAFISEEDLAMLLADGGEACVAVEI